MGSYDIFMYVSCFVRTCPANITHWTSSIFSPVLLFMSSLCSSVCVYVHVVKPWLGTWRKTDSVVPLLFLHSPFPAFRSLPPPSSVCERGCVVVHLSCAYERRCAPFTFLGLVAYFINAFLIKY